MVSRTVEVAVASEALLGESPRWDAAAGRFMWIDIDRGELHVDDLKIELGTPVGTVVPIDERYVLVALADRIATVDLEVGSHRDEVRFPHGGDVRANDGVCDPTGRLWVGSMSVDEESATGALYVYDGATLERVLDGVIMSNGIGWSPDATRMYHVDSMTYKLDVFDYDGEISGRRTLVEIAEDDGIPDGLAVDDEGCIWVALWGGYALHRYDAQGVLVEKLAVPAENPTACCFVDDVLYVTTAAPDGRIYRCDVGVTGPPAQPFRSTAPSAAGPTSAR